MADPRRRTILGAATLWPRGEAPNVWGDVDSAALGRGLGTALLELAEARASELGAAVVRSDVFAQDEIAVTLLEGRGHRPVRRYYEMRIMLGDEAPSEPEWPEGLIVAPFRDGDGPEFHRVLTEAFRDEWGGTDGVRGVAASPIEADDVELAIWPLVRDGDEVVAVVRCDAFRYGGGWVAGLGVVERWRRRGIGLALLQHTFGVFHARGERSIGLGVNSENPTGATRLYERAGMHVELESVTFEKSLA